MIELSQRETLQKLIDALESPMPSGFQWKFEVVYGRFLDDNWRTFACGCAIGLARHLGLVDAAFPNALTQMAEAFGISRLTAGQVFLGFNGEYGDISNDDITPKMVAERLRARTAQ